MESVKKMSKGKEKVSDDTESVKKMSKGKEKVIDYYDMESVMSKGEEKVCHRSPITDIDSESDDDSEEEEEKISLTSGEEDYDYDGFPENECGWDREESDEELIRDSDRKEIRRYGFRFVVKKGRTVTNPRRPQKTYIPRNSMHSNSVLYDKQYPLDALAKLALSPYNAIRGTDYKYIGLVKAYKGGVAGFIFWIRFKACLRAQPPIDFQAIVYRGISERTKPGRKTRDVPIDIQFVYPLP